MKSYSFQGPVALSVVGDSLVIDAPDTVKVTISTGSNTPPVVGSNPPTPKPVAVPPSRQFTSPLAEMVYRQPIALNWRYGGAAELRDAIAAKGFKMRTVLHKKDGSTEEVVPGDKNIEPVDYVEQSDGSVVYDKYLDAIVNQAASGRSDPLRAYAFRAEALNDFDAIDLQQQVRINGTQVWPTTDKSYYPGFGPPFDYTELPDGTLTLGTADGDITIRDF